MGEQLELFPKHTPRQPALGVVSRAPKRGAKAGMRVTVLQSGSAGNATLVQAGDTHILIDCGLGIRILTARLKACGITPEDLAAVLVTHEHSDHIGGCARLASGAGVPLYMTQGTYEAGIKRLRGAGVKERVRILPMRGWLAFRGGAAVDDDPDSVDLSVDWVPVSHDGRDTVAYACQRQSFRFGVLTDLGVVTEPVRRMIASLDAVSLESNHDVDLLKMSSYPPFVIRRILGAGGHLSNDQAAALITESASSRLHTILLAHLSERANEPARAFDVMSGVAGGRRIILTEHREAIDPLEL